MKVLVGTLFSGENEFADCVKSLRLQDFNDWEHVVIENKPNKEAHDSLYKHFMAHPEFDKYLKLDADMVLQPGALGEMVEASKGADLMLAYVRDVPSGLMIPGIQMFSNRCIWPVNDDHLNVDVTPTYPGKMERIRDKDWVLHNPNPSEFQAFKYGVHRALKCIQPGAFYKSLLHFTILKNIWRQPRTRERMLSILGAELVFQCAPQELKANYCGSYARTAFNEASKNLEKWWGKINPSMWDEETFANDRLYVLLHSDIWKQQKKVANA